MVQEGKMSRKKRDYQRGNEGKRGKIKEKRSCGGQEWRKKKS